MFARRARRLEVGQRGRKISLPSARFRSRPGERSVAKVVPGYLVEQRSDGLRVARPATKVVGEVTTRRVCGWRGDPYSRQQAGRPAEPAGRRHARSPAACGDGCFADRARRPAPSAGSSRHPSVRGSIPIPRVPPLGRRGRGGVFQSRPAPARLPQDRDPRTARPKRARGGLREGQGSSARRGPRRTGPAGRFPPCGEPPLAGAEKPTPAPSRPKPAHRLDRAGGLLQNERRRWRDLGRRRSAPRDRAKWASEVAGFFVGTAWSKQEMG